MVMKPPSGGPSTGAARPGQVRVVIARIMSFLSIERSTTRRPTGTIMAPPMPWRTRARVKVSRLSLSPHRIEAPVKMMMALANTRRLPNRSAIQPLSGMRMAKVST